MFNLFHKPKNIWVGVDIGSTMLRLLQLSFQNNQYRVESYVAIPVPEQSVVDGHILNVETISHILMQAVQSLDVELENVVLALPHTMVIEKIITMDTDMTDEEREIQVRMDIEHELPFSLDEASLDFTVLAEQPDPDTGQVNVLCVAAQTEHIETRVDIIEGAGLSAKVVDVESYAKIRALDLMQDDWVIKQHCIAILELDPNVVKLLVVQAGEIKYSRTHQLTKPNREHKKYQHDLLAVNQLIDAPEMNSFPQTSILDEQSLVCLEHTMQQIEHAFQGFILSAQGNEINQVYLIGEGVDLPSYLPQLQQLGYRAMIFNPLINMTCSEQVKVSTLQNDAPALMVACGLALRGMSHGSN